MAVSYCKFTHNLGPKVVMEESAFPLTVTYFDGNTVTAPGAATAYKVVNPQSRKIVRDWTTLGSPATTEIISVTKADNTLSTTTGGINDYWRAPPLATNENRALFVRDSGASILGRFTWSVADTAMDS